MQGRAKGRSEGREGGKEMDTATNIECRRKYSENAESFRDQSYSQNQSLSVDKTLGLEDFCLFAGSMNTSKDPGESEKGAGEGERKQEKKWMRLPVVSRAKDSTMGMHRLFQIETVPGESPSFVIVLELLDFRMVSDIRLSYRKLLRQFPGKQTLILLICSALHEFAQRHTGWVVRGQLFDGESALLASIFFSLYPSSSHIALGNDFASPAVTKEYEDKVIENVRAPHVEATKEVEKPITAEVTYMVNSKDSTAEVSLDAKVIEIDDNSVDDDSNIDYDQVTTASEEALEPEDLVFDAEADSKGGGDLLVDGELIYAHEYLEEEYAKLTVSHRKVV
jgi:hypothetical protein